MGYCPEGRKKSDITTHTHAMCKQKKKSTIPKESVLPHLFLHLKKCLKNDYLQEKQKLHANKGFIIYIVNSSTVNRICLP